MARPFKPDVVFLDIGLPSMNGYEVAKRMRAEPSLSKTVLVALTGWGSEYDKRQSAQAGCDFHLTKPVEATAIENILARVVSGQK
jgi:CheY-like chemotaxis protein